MSILRDFEKRLGSLVEGLFAKTFRAGLQPVELAKRVLREMDSGRTVGVDGRVVVPNRYQFKLSPVDRERLDRPRPCRPLASSSGVGHPDPPFLGRSLATAIRASVGQGSPLWLLAPPVPLVGESL